MRTSNILWIVAVAACFELGVTLLTGAASGCAPTKSVAQELPTTAWVGRTNALAGIKLMHYYTVTADGKLELADVQELVATLARGGAICSAYGHNGTPCKVCGHSPR